MTHTDYDVVIVGAGPAGSSAANELATLLPNSSIFLADRKKEIGYPVQCAEGVWHSKMKQIGQDVPEKYIEATITKQEFNFENTISYEVDLPEKYLILNRCGFDKYLATAAKKKESL